MRVLAALPRRHIAYDRPLFATGFQRIDS